MDDKTIYALSTVYGKSGVAIFRISGKNALDAIKFLTNIDCDNIKSRYAYFSQIHDINGSALDNALVLYFKLIKFKISASLKLSKTSLLALSGVKFSPNTVKRFKKFL